MTYGRYNAKHAPSKSSETTQEHWEQQILGYPRHRSYSKVGLRNALWCDHYNIRDYNLAVIKLHSQNVPSNSSLSLLLNTKLWCWQGQVDSASHIHTAN